MHAYLSFLVTGAFLVSSATAQTHSASLQANLPLEIDFNGVQSHPAGPITSNGQISRVVNLGFASATARTIWTVPTTNDLACNVTIALETGSLGTSIYPAFFQSDTTMNVTGPVGTWGTVEIEIVHYGGNWPTVGIGGNGNNALLGSFYGGVGSGSLRRSWSIPVQLTQQQLPIRIRHGSISQHSELYQSISVRFVPWSASAIDLGTRCPENHSGWVIGKNADQDYGLTVRPGTATAAAVLHARGYGHLQAFVLGSQGARLPTGTLAFGHGCDDLLTNVIVTVPGTATSPFAQNEWTLDIPPMQPGLTFFLQHVSLGSIASTTYFGATNIARYQT